MQKSNRPLDQKVTVTYLKPLWAKPFFKRFAPATIILYPNKLFVNKKLEFLRESKPIGFGSFLLYAKFLGLYNTLECNFKLP